MFVELGGRGTIMVWERSKLGRITATNRLIVDAQLPARSADVSETDLPETHTHTLQSSPHLPAAPFALSFWCPLSPALSASPSSSPSALLPRGLDT